jgi:hypothetical protein
MTNRLTPTPSPTPDDLISNIKTGLDGLVQTIGLGSDPGAGAEPAIHWRIIQKTSNHIEVQRAWDKLLAGVEVRNFILAWCAAILIAWAAKSWLMGRKSTFKSRVGVQALFAMIYWPVVLAGVPTLLLGKDFWNAIRTTMQVASLYWI